MIDQTLPLWPLPSCFVPLLDASISYVRLSASSLTSAWLWVIIVCRADVSTSASGHGHRGRTNKDKGFAQITQITPYRTVPYSPSNGAGQVTWTLADNQITRQISRSNLMACTPSAEEGARGPTSAHHLVILRLIEQVSSACNSQLFRFPKSHPSKRTRSKREHDRFPDYQLNVS
jgi:hypothetical protein